MTRQNGARTGAWALVLATLWLALTGGGRGERPIGVLVVAGALAAARTLGAP